MATTLPTNIIDGIVTDPPYHLSTMRNPSGMQKNRKDGPFKRLSRGFMGQEWDGGDISFRHDTWAEVYRVMKPGAYLAAFGAPRTVHRMTVAIEDAGFEIRDTLMWLHGQGFPKSKGVALAIDKHFGHPNRGCAIPTASTRQPGPNGAELYSNPVPPYHARTDAAIAYEGWGTALKPAYEPIILARKPLIGTIAENVLAFGTGGLNIDVCRIPTADKLGGGMLVSGKPILQLAHDIGWDRPWMHDEAKCVEMAVYARAKTQHAENLGRWPANILHDGSDEVMDIFARFGERKSCKSPSSARSSGSIFGGARSQGNLPLDAGTAARFYYCAKASESERCGSGHPTVKPVKLLEWLINLITPPGGLLLDPFAGIGSTGQAARNLGFDFILIEQDETYVTFIHQRLG
jgi:site-specific DNA-methyltransferase (adenine-specific)